MNGWDRWDRWITGWSEERVQVEEHDLPLLPLPSDVQALVSLCILVQMEGAEICV